MQQQCPSCGSQLVIGLGCCAARAKRIQQAKPRFALVTPPQRNSTLPRHMSTASPVGSTAPHRAFYVPNAVPPMRPRRAPQPTSGLVR